MIDAESLAPGGRRSALAVIGLTTLVTAAGYGLTLLQQAIYARVLGVNAGTDSLAVVLAWAMGTTGLIGTTLSTIYLPDYVRARQRGHGEADQLQLGATRVALAVGLVLAVITVLGAPLLAKLLFPAVAPDQVDSLVGLIRLSAPLEVTWILIWITVSTVNATERYRLAAASWALPPIPLIVVLLLPSPSIDRVVMGYIAGTVLQLGALWYLEPASTPRFAEALRSGVWKNVGSALLPVGVTFGLLSCVPLIVRALSSFHGEGAVATADYASRLVLAGQQVLLSGLLAVTFTRWSQRAAAQGTDGASSGAVRRTLLIVLGAAVATAIVLPIAAVPLTQLVLAGGRFSGADAVAVGTFVGWMAPGVGGHMILMVAARALLAERQFAPLVIGSAAAVGLLVLVGAAMEATLGLNAVAAGYSAGYLGAAVITFVGVWSRRRKEEAS